MYVHVTHVNWRIIPQTGRRQSPVIFFFFHALSFVPNPGDLKIVHIVPSLIRQLRRHALQIPLRVLILN